MANPGLGYRSVFEMVCEMSLHLIEPVVRATLITPITPGLQTVTISTTVDLVQGATIIIDPGTPNAESIILTSVTTTQIQAIFANAHLAGAALIGACFPTQAATDPFFTQAEILGYISRAQNEFLARVPSYFLVMMSQINFGQIIQALPCTPIELIRVALSSTGIAITSLTRVAGVVTAVTASPHNLLANGKFSLLNPPDITFAGAFKVATIISPTSFTYSQALPNAATNGGIVGLLVRLYEVTREMLYLTNPGWENQFITAPTKWFEDRSGNYAYGVNGHPSSNFPVELLMSIRDTDALAMLDGFLVPDLLIHLVKYKALEFAWSKDGEQRQPDLARFCGMRFDRGVMASLRWLDAMMGAQLTPPAVSKRKG